MTDTTNYHFPLIAENQSSKFVTHNDALVMIDSVIYGISGGFIVPAPGIVYSDGLTLNAAGIDATLTFASGTLSLSLGHSNAWTKSQRSAPSTLTDGSSIAVDLSLSNNFTLTLGGNHGLANPSNANPGQAGIIVVKQDATGGRTLSYASNYKFASGTAPVLSTAANALDVLSYYVVDSTHVLILSALNFS